MQKRFFLLIACSLLVLETKATENIFSRETTPHSARVVIANDPKATIAFQAQPEKVRALVNRGLLQFAEKTNLASAWQSLISTNDIVGIKVYSTPGANSGTRPSVVAAVIEGLLAAGILPKRIVIWDKEMTALRLAGFVELADRYQVKVAASAMAGYDEKTFYESPLIGNLIWGDVEFGKKGDGIGRKSFVTKLVEKEITKIISIVPLLNHNVAGTTGNLLSLALGSVDNTHRFDQPDRLARALPEIYALPSLGDKVVLNITDALICQYQGEQKSLLHYSAPLNEIWFSKDPIALDVLAIRELNRQREIAKVPKDKTLLEIYENASLLELGVSNWKSIQIERTP
ncbi:MAG: DUF362 domain-containing protein [Verrucomicrobiota bacterium]